MLAIGLASLFSLFIARTAIAEHAPTNTTKTEQNQGSSRPLVGPNDFQTVASAQQLFSNKCTPLHFKRFESVDDLTKEYKAAGLIQANEDQTGFLRALGIVEADTMKLLLNDDPKDREWIQKYLSKALPSGTPPNRDVLRKIHQSLIDFSVELNDKAWADENKVKPLASGTGFFIGPNGHALTALHTLHAAIVTDKWITPHQIEQIAKEGVNPVTFPNGIELQLNYFNVGGNNSSNGIENFPIKKIRVLLTAPIPVNRKTFVDESTRGGIGKRDWALIEVVGAKESKLWSGDFFELSEDVIDQESIRTKRLFLAGYPTNLHKFP